MHWHFILQKLFVLEYKLYYTAAFKFDKDQPLLQNEKVWINVAWIWIVIFCSMHSYDSFKKCNYHVVPSLTVWNLWFLHGEYVHGGLMHCENVRTCRWLITFQRNTLPLSSAKDGHMLPETYRHPPACGITDHKTTTDINYCVHNHPQN